MGLVIHNTARYLQTAGKTMALQAVHLLNVMSTSREQKNVMTVSHTLTEKYVRVHIWVKVPFALLTDQMSHILCVKSLPLLK